MKLIIKLDEHAIKNKILNADIGTFVAKEWHGIISRYIPRRSGMLMNDVEYQPWKIIYKAPYADIVYRGERKGEQLIFKRDKNPLATAYWDKAAAADGQLAELYRRVNRKLRGDIAYG